jgi:hypothetical protein
MLQASGTHTVRYQAEQVLDSSSSSSGRVPAAMCSITAMPAYTFKSTEELRLEDYMNGNKFGSNVARPGPQFPAAQQYIFGSNTAAAAAAAPAKTDTAQPAYQTTLVQERSSSDGSTCMVAMFTVAAMPSYVHMSTEELRFENYQAGKKSAADVKPASSLPDVPSTITAQKKYQHLSTEELRFQNYQSGMTSGLVAAAAAVPAAPATAIAAPSCSTPTRSTLSAGWSDAAAGCAGAIRSPKATLLEIKYPQTWQDMNTCSKSFINWQVLQVVAAQRWH